MPFNIKVEELKKVARLVTGLKDVSPAAVKKYHLNGLHRVIAEGGRFRMLTTDGDFSLDWNVPVQDGLGGEEFDLVIPAGQFNEMIARASPSSDFDLEYLPSSGRLVFRQGQRTLRLEATPPSIYPTPPSDIGSPSWVAEAGKLSEALGFITPFIDATNPKAARAVATLKCSGSLVAGSPKRHARVTGLATPTSPMNLKQKAAKVLAAFLDALTGLVEVAEMSGTGKIHIATPDSLRSVIVPAESTPFEDGFSKLETGPHEVWKVDRKTWIHGISIIQAVQPPKADRQTLRVRGDKDMASMRISSPTIEALASHDEFSIHRAPFVGGTAPTEGDRAEHVLDVNAESVRDGLQAMSSNVVTVEHYAGPNMLVIHDGNSTETSRPDRTIVFHFARHGGNSATASTVAIPAREGVHEGRDDDPTVPLTPVVADLETEQDGPVGTPVVQTAPTTS